MFGLRPAAAYAAAAANPLCICSLPTYDSNLYPFLSSLLERKERERGREQESESILESRAATRQRLRRQRYAVLPAAAAAAAGRCALTRLGLTAALAAVSRQAVSSNLSPS